MITERDDLQRIIDEALESMAAEAPGDFDPQRCNLAEFCRRTGLTRSKARTIKANGFRAYDAIYRTPFHVPPVQCTMRRRYKFSR